MALLLVLVLAGGPASGAGGRGGAQAQTLLRLGELPPEYVLGGDTGCGALHAEAEDPKPMASFAARYRPMVCDFEYERLFVLPGLQPNPPDVDTFAIGTGSAEGARAGLGVAGTLLGAYLGDPAIEEVPTTARVGEETRLFHTDRAFALGRPGQTASAYFWRSGSSLSGLYVGGLPFASADAVALQLAQAQQRHVEAPTPYTRAERDDAEVPFEDPAVRFPVYWLGRTFAPGHGLPPSRLEDAFLAPRSAPSGMKELVSYGRITIGSWTARSWRKREGRGEGELLLGWRCTKATGLRLPSGRATIYAGYREDFAECPRSPPDVFAAVAHLGRLVIGIDVPGCDTCVEAGRGPYHSRRDMAIILRGLRLRERPGG